MNEDEIFQIEHPTKFKDIGKKESFPNLVDKTFLVHDFVIGVSIYYENKELATLKCSDLDKKEFFITWTTSKPILETLKENENKIKEGKIMKVTLKKKLGRRGYYFIFI